MQGKPIISAKPEPSLKAIPLLKRFWPWMRPHVGHIYVVLALQLIATPLAVVVPLVVRRVVDDALVRGDRSELAMWAGVLVLMALVGAAAVFISASSLLKFRVKVLHRLRLALYRHMQRLSRSYYADRETGELMSRQTDDVNNLQSVLADGLVRVFVAGLRGTAYLGMLFYVEWHLAGAGLVFVAAMYGISHAASGRLRRLANQALERWTILSSSIHQGLSGHLLVKATAGESREALRFSKDLHQSIRADVRRDMFDIYVNRVYDILTGTAPALIVLLGIQLIMTTDFTIGGLFAFFMYLGQLLAASSVVVGFNSSLQSSLASLNRIFEVLDEEPEIRSARGGGQKLSVVGAIELEDVSFSYEPGRPVLDALNVVIPPHARVALVGPSGAGKSTFGALIQRFHDPGSGRILIDGVDLRELDVRGYRNQVGYVPQDVFLFDRTVAENISLGRRGVDPEQIRAAARAANAADFIEALPAGYDTEIGERGMKLSGGQRQRVAIARELLRDPSILILDEATSALDSESEALIQEALERLLKGRTSVIIAHRLSTIIGCDVILVMEEGRIVEQGRHDELLAIGGRYSSVYRSQFERHVGSARAVPESSVMKGNLL